MPISPGSGAMVDTDGGVVRAIDDCEAMLSRIGMESRWAQALGTSARGAQDPDRADEGVARPNSGAGLTVGVAVRGRHGDGDCGSDLLSRDGLLEPGHDSAKREVNRSASFVAAVEHRPVAPVDTHVADGNRCGTGDQ